MRHILIICTIFICGISYSQDNIVLKNGEEISAKVLEIGIGEIKYKKASNPEGPTYTISKSDVFMIKYENGTKEVINTIEASATKTTESTAKESTKKPDNPSGKKSYIDKVRDIQNTDPTFSFHVGNAWLGHNGIFKPLLGIDVRFPRKNVFIRSISVGARASFAGIDDKSFESGIYSEVYAYTLTVKYIAPIPVKVVQPYFTFHAGAAYRNHYNNFLASGDFVSSDLLPVVHAAVGSNFMFSKYVGGFIETGYFSTGFINTGLVFKMGRTIRNN